jgi:hypothetical protein
MSDSQTSIAHNKPPVENPLTSIANTIAFDVRDWSDDKRLAWIYGIVLGWDSEDDDDNGAMAELQEKFKWFDLEVARLRRLRKKFKELEEVQP